MPFILVTESSTGSSWLMQELSLSPAVCIVGVEPLDDRCGANGAPLSNSARAQVRWLRAFLAAPERTRDLASWRGTWRTFLSLLIEKSLPCRAEELAESLSMDRCDAVSTGAIGFKTSLFAGGLLTKRRGNKWLSLKSHLDGAGVRIIRLKRKNRLQHGLAILRKEMAQRGHLVPKVYLPTTRVAQVS